MAAIPRYRPRTGPVVLSAGFRPFFLLSALWASLAIPIWLAFFAGQSQVATAFSPAVWHAHEMIFGFGAATVAGFLLTAIPNWTGRMPLQGAPLAVLVLIWITGRIAVLFSADIGAESAAVLDLAFPLVFLAVIAREILAGRNWRNLPMLGALTLLLAGNFLVHLDALDLAETAELGNRLGVATLLMLITLVGGRIVPSFTRNWLAKERPEISAPAGFGAIDRAVLTLVALTLISWVLAPDSKFAAWAALAGGLAVALRLTRWRGGATLREPMLWVLHLGYGWLALGFLLLSFNGFVPLLPPTTALHAFTVGAIGTMMLGVMTRASLGHTGRPLVAGPGTTTIYVLVTLAAILRLLAPLTGAKYLTVLLLAGAAWSGAFGLFVLLYARPLAQPQVKGEAARPI
jgi:uncharacterized protein involved in response to NO